MNTAIEPKRYKRSRQRERILDVLRSTKSHPTAAWIYDSLKGEFPDLSLGTVYRNLNILHEQGRLQVLQSGSTFDRFDADTSAHYHFVCRSCGKVEDVELPVVAELDAAAAALLGHCVEGHRTDFYGLCSACNAGAAEGADSAATPGMDKK